MWACLLEAFADHGEYFLTDHAFLIYEEYVNVAECILHALQPLPMQWQKNGSCQQVNRGDCNVFPLMRFAAVPDGAAAFMNPSRPSSSLANLFTVLRKKLFLVPAAPEIVSKSCWALSCPCTLTLMM